MRLIDCIAAYANLPPNRHSRELSNRADRASERTEVDKSARAKSAQSRRFARQTAPEIVAADRHSATRRRADRIAGCDVASWPSTDVPIALANVSFRGRSGSGADLLRCRSSTHQRHSKPALRHHLLAHCKSYSSLDRRLPPPTINSTRDQGWAGAVFMAEMCGERRLPAILAGDRECAKLAN
jgi:hypothetical protein